MRCSLVSPYSAPDPPPGEDPLSWWAQRVVEKSWGEADPEVDGMGNAIVSSVACTVLSVTGWLAQSSIVKSGTMKFAKHTMEDAARPGSSLLVLRVAPRWPADCRRNICSTSTLSLVGYIFYAPNTANPVPAKSQNQGTVSFNRNNMEKKMDYSLQMNSP